MLKTSSETLDFVTKLFINDPNVLTVEIDHTDKSVPKIIIKVENDSSESNYLKDLNEKLKGYLRDQKFLVDDRGESTILIELIN